MFDRLPEAVATRVHRTAELVQKRGGEVWAVGGAVLAEIQDRPATDIDLEVHRLPAAELEAILAEVFPETPAPALVGRAYGIYSFHVADHTIELSIPRRDTQTGTGHADVAVELDPLLGLPAAAQRRDFTIGAIYQNVVTNAITDPVGGLQDFQDKKLRIINHERFSEDPLRVLRAIQLTGRYGLSVDEKSRNTLQATVPKTAHLSRERFSAEWEKLFLKSDQPSLGLQLAHDIGYFSLWAPSLEQLARTEQSPQHHPEGNAWVHTLLVVDNVKRLAPNDLPILLAAMFHDLGKSTMSVVDDQGHIQTSGHEEAAIAPTKDFLARQGFSNDMITRVTRLVQEHMRPFQLYAERDRLGPGAIRRLANRLAPATIPEVATLALADYFGRSTDEYQVLVRPAVDWLLQQAHDLQYDQGRPSPVLQGRDLIARGWDPSPLFKEILVLAENLAEQGFDRRAILELLHSANSPSETIEVFQSRIKPPRDFENTCGHRTIKVV